MFTFPGDWDSVKPEVVRAIYPGQASWQFVSGDNHLGGEKALSGTACASCHGNAMLGQSSVAGWAGPPPVNHREGTGCAACHGVLQQRIGELGQSLVNHPVLELNPIAGKLPYVDVSVQAAYDSEYIYMRFRMGLRRARGEARPPSMGRREMDPAEYSQAQPRHSEL
jgi:hypothetical protein